MANVKQGQFHLSEAAMKKYLGCLNRDLGDLKRAMERSDLAQVKEICHRLRGSAGLYGFEDLGQACGEVEDSCVVGAGFDAVVSGVQVIEVIFSRSLPPAEASGAIAG